MYKRAFNPSVLTVITAIGLLLGSACSKKLRRDEASADKLKMGLAAYFPFDNESNDAPGNNEAGAIYNVSPVTDRFGRQNKALYFDGAKSYMTVPDNKTLRISQTDFTLSAWVKPESYNSSYGSIILSKRYTGLNKGWMMSIGGFQQKNTGGVNFGPGGGGLNAFGNKVVPLDKWSLITCVYELASQTLKTYVDGDLDQTSGEILSPNQDIDALIYIGKDNPDVSSNVYYFKGAMDDVRIYTRALSAGEVKELFNYTDSK